MDGISNELKELIELEILTQEKKDRDHYEAGIKRRDGRIGIEDILAHRQLDNLSGDLT